MPLTDARVRSLKATPSPTKHSDGGGLHLLISPQGSKLWRLAYRFGGKQKILALGVYPVVNLSASTLLNESGKWLPDAIEVGLAHAGTDEVRRTYRRAAYWDDRVKMAEWWASEIDLLRHQAGWGVYS